MPDGLKKLDSKTVLVTSDIITLQNLKTHFINKARIGPYAKYKILREENHQHNLFQSIKEVWTN